VLNKVAPYPKPVSPTNIAHAMPHLGFNATSSNILLFLP